MELANWLNSIAERRWPILPDTLVQVQDACSRHPDLINFTDLANLTLTDPFLVFDMMRMIGGSRALQRNESMPSMEQAMMMIGLETLVARFNRLGGLEPVEGTLDAPVIEVVGQWLARSRVAALIIKDWLSITGEHKVEDCYVAALMYNMPACLFLLYRNQLPERPLLQEVSETFETDYPKLLEQFVRILPLPSALLTLLSVNNGSNRRKQLLKLAVATANGMEQGCWRSQWVAGLEAAARTMGVPFDEAYRAIPLAVRSVARHSRAVGYSYPARELIMLPGEYHRPEMRPAGALGDAGRLEETIKESLRHLANDLKFSRILFLRYEHDLHALKLRYQIGLPMEHPLRKMLVELEPGSFMALLTSKPQSFHAPEMVRAQLARKYEDPFFTHMGDNEFAIMSLFVGHKLAGVFYADKGAEPIDVPVYQRFKELVSRVAQHH